MTARLRGRFIASALAVPLAVTLAACGGSSSGGSSSGGGDNDSDSETGAAHATCESHINQKASTPLPSGIPAPEGASDPYEYFAQGATKVWYFALDGTPADLPSLRDSYDNALSSKGYKIKDTDKEENAEAESEFGGPHHGTTNFRPLCEGKVNFRLKVSS